MTDCLHESVTERRKKKSNGAIVIARQCNTCGITLNEVEKAGRILARLEWFDQTIGERYDAERRADQEALRHARDEKFRVEQETRTGEWWDRYDEYLASDHWRRIREIVLARDVLCQKCFVNRATQAHHIFYKTFGEHRFSFAQECAGVCKACHDQLHPKRTP